MEDCVFCKIVNGEIPCAKVYENEDVLAFLDASPFSKGHCLIVPKKHFENIYEIDQENLEKVITITKDVSVKIKIVLNADGIRISQSNGAVAGQAIFHIHFHVIPRYENDGLRFDEVGNKPASAVKFEDLQKIAEEINR
jgi:histidine triad (HIT) family protein